MAWIKSFLINIFSFFAVAPFILFFILWIIFFIVYKQKKKAMEIAMDITAVFLIIAVSSMYNDIFNSKIGFWLIALFYLLAIGLMGSAQNRLKGRLDFAKLYKVVWRVGFLILAFIYVLFVIIGIIKGLF